MKRKPNIIVTNDDGILSEGSLPLAEALSKTGRVTAVLPDRMRSACSHSISLHKALRLRKIRPGVYVSDGTPVDCVRLGVLAVLKDKADMVVSGINAGPNLGDDLNYSGTVAAAREAAFLGIRAVSVSLAQKKKRGNFKAAIEITKKILPAIMKADLPEKVFFNVNIPDVPLPDPRRQSRKSGKRIYDRAVVGRKDPRGGKYYWLAGGKLSGKMVKGTDIEALSRNYVSVMPVTLDYTAYGVVENLKNTLQIRI